MTIKQTIHPRVQTHIPAISKSYRFNGGTATVQVDSLGNYEVIVNGNRFSPQENSAKRDANYKPAIATISNNMIAAFEKRDAEFTAMHKKASRLKKFADSKKEMEAIVLQRYQREQFPLSRPMREDVRKELDEEAAIKFADLYVDKQKDRNDYVAEHEKEAMTARLRAYEEVQSFFYELQDYKEARVNACFLNEYNRQCKEVQNFIDGEPKSTESRILMILGELSLPFRVDISCDYDASIKLLSTEIELYEDMNLPINKANILSSGKISVKDKLVKEFEQFKTETIMSMVYYIAASLFNAAIGINTQQVSVWLKGKYEGLLWIQFDRNRFGKFSLRTVNPMQNYYDWPRVDTLRMVRGAFQFETMVTSDFQNAIIQVKIENGIYDVSQDSSSLENSSEYITVTIDYAQTIANALPNDATLQAIVEEAQKQHYKKVNISKKYKGILNDLKK